MPGTTVLSEEHVLQRAKCASLAQVKNLNLWGNDLSDVSILQRIPNLEVCSLSVNRINTLKDFSNLVSLRELYLRKNEISDLDEVRYLQSLPNLQVLWLADNPIAERTGYKDYVRKLLPHLARFDSEQYAELDQPALSPTEMPLTSGAGVGHGDHPPQPRRLSGDHIDRRPSVREAREIWKQEQTAGGGGVLGTSKPSSFRSRPFPEPQLVLSKPQALETTPERDARRARDTASTEKMARLAASARKREQAEAAAQHAQGDAPRPREGVRTPTEEREGKNYGASPSYASRSPYREANPYEDESAQHHRLRRAAVAPPEPMMLGGGGGTPPGAGFQGLSNAAVLPGAASTGAVVPPMPMPRGPPVVYGNGGGYVGGGSRGPGTSSRVGNDV